ncbi:hypothetical protein [Arthrospira sp. PCC 8006]
MRNRALLGQRRSDRFWGGLGRGGNGFATEEDGTVGEEVGRVLGF